MSRVFTPEQKAARAAATKRWRERNPEAVRVSAQRSRLKNPEPARASRRRWYQKIKLEVFAAYGNHCACCGEPNVKFLTFDHAQNQGAAHRKAVGSSSASAMKDARANGYPKDLYQLLCWNCNCGRAMNGGICPHVEMTPNG